MKQMKQIVVWASIQYAVHVDGATMHVAGPDERQVEFGDGTTSFATLSGGPGFLNSTVNVYASDFVTMAGTSVNEMMTLIQDQQATIASQQVEIEALKQFVMPPPSMPPSVPPPVPPPPVPPPPVPPPHLSPPTASCACRGGGRTYIVVDNGAPHSAGHRQGQGYTYGCGEGVAQCCWYHCVGSDWSWCDQSHYSSGPEPLC